jgi:hypothetical protein
LCQPGDLALVVSVMKGTRTQNDNFFYFKSILSIEFLWKHVCLEYGHKFVVDFTVTKIWEYKKSYLNGLKINIGQDLKW